MNVEEWKTVFEFPKCEVSNEGRVRNKKTGHYICLTDNGHGYLQVKLGKEGKFFNRLVHRIVADAFCIKSGSLQDQQ